MPTTDALSEADGQVAVGTALATIEAPGNDLITWINREIAGAMPHVEAWRTEAEKCYRFRDGKQLDDKDKKKLEDEGRPDNAFNTAQKFIRFVTGVERHTPEALIYEPIDETDLGQQTLGEVMTRYYDWAIAKTYGDYERSRAFDDLIVTGMGWTDAFVDRTIDPKGLISLKRIPGNEMVWPKCGDQNLSTTRWRARQSKVNQDEAIAMWPDREWLIKMGNFNGVPTVPVRPEANKTVIYKIPYIETEELKSYEAGGDPEDHTVRITEFQWYDNLPGVFFFDPLEKEAVWYEQKKFERYKSTLAKVTGGDPAYEIVDWLYQSQKVYQKVFILNEKWQLGKVMELPGKRFTFNCMTGYYDEEDKVFYGYMRILIDPQRFANKFFNQVIEIMGTQAKGGLIVEENQIPGNKVALFEKKYAVPGSVNEVAQGAIAMKRIMPKPLPELPIASIEIINFCIKGMENVTGIDPETMFGQGSGGNVAGVTLKQKQKSGLLLLNQEFSSLSRFRIEEGYILFDLLKTLADDRLIRVGKPYEGTVLRLMRAPFAAEYDLMLDEQERDPNIRHMYAESVLAIAPTLIRMNKFLPEMLDYFPLPVHFRQTLKKAIVDAEKAEQEAIRRGQATHGRGNPPSPEERAAKVEKIKAETMASIAKAQRLHGQMNRDAQRAQLDEIKTLLNVMVEAQRLKLDKEKMAAEDMSKAVDFYLERQGQRSEMAQKLLELSSKEKIARESKKGNGAEE